MEIDIPRRSILTAGLLLGGSALSSTLTGCSFFSTTPDNADKDGQTAISGAKESPMLAALVQQGKLPPLAERLPKNPAVVHPLTKTGAFGGTFRKAHVEPADAFPMRSYGRSCLAEWNLETTGPQPGLAESWDIENGGRRYVFHLRQGVKWSDGKPFTTDDLMFVYQHVFQNKILTPVPWGWLSPKGKPAVFEQIDDHTIAFSFADPHGLLLKFFCFPDLGLGLMLPKHYLSQFHPDFTKAADLAQQAKAGGYNSWNDLFAAKNDIWLNPDRPVLGAWKVARPARAGGTAIAERNPYYWKVDPDGRQLPYVDKISFFFAQPETIVLRAANGDLDLGTIALTFRDMPVLLRTAEAKKYKVYRWKDDAALPAISLNQNHPDEVLRKLFGELDFRAALSHAINRPELNETLYVGQGIIQHPCGQAEDIYFEKGMGQRFIEFDLAKANELLDGLGLTERDAQGFRLRPDGKKLRLELMIQDQQLVELYQLIVGYWAKAGIDAFAHLIAGELWWQRLPQAKYDIACSTTETYIWDIDPGSVVPAGLSAFWAPLYGTWYQTNGQSGVEPTGDIRKLQTLYDQLKQEIDDKARLEVGRQILRLHDQNVWILGTVMTPAHPLVANADLINIREHAMESYHVGSEMATLMEQVSYQDPAKH
ncbi:ABC transporter substrate-binding protein [Kribbella sp. NPDC055071]